jgi:aspartyl/asparaginyl-tRNA synthetase
MQRTLNTALASRVGRRATVQGWVHRRRRLARVSFLIIRDRGGLAQVVLGDEDGRAQLDDLGEETVVCVDGMVTANARASGGVALMGPCITTLSSPAATPPVELWRPSLNASLGRMVGVRDRSATPAVHVRAYLCSPCCPCSSGLSPDATEVKHLDWSTELACFGSPQRR